MSEKVWLLLSSRRFWLAVMAVVGIVAQDLLGINLDTDTLAGAIAIVIGLIMALTQRAPGVAERPQGPQAPPTVGQ